MDEPKLPRLQEEIFADLRALAQEEGALHEISALFYRDWILTVDLQEGKVTDDPEQRWSTEKLNTNEIMLLVGLMVQAPDNRTFAHEVQGTDFAERADRLFREFHDRVNEDARAVFDLTSQKFLEKPDSLGMFGARRSITARSAFTCISSRVSRVTVIAMTAPGTCKTPGFRCGR